ncbi:hypothetical protein FA13DRAFT_1198459 [Coprinellus micaceus]|jgi:hypothetical protein|uniref:Uncharacterized protein n=1 Tax=Coprinellus micaceus TaxID=71717 RepID=A0A4Y7TNR0_COPMI|nr:hypothetical protein FA13DRAFT_1198459 [Coprinellus micaceus]
MVEPNAHVLVQSSHSTQSIKRASKALRTVSEGDDQFGVHDDVPSNTGRAPGWEPQPLERGPFERTLKAFFQQRHFVLDPAALVTEGENWVS